MKVVLLQDVKGIGQRMDVKEVKDGYARNYLIPNKLAVIADKIALVKQESVKKQEQADFFRYQEFVKKLEQERLEFQVKTGEKGEVFEPISRDKIKKTLEAKGYRNFEVVLPQSIRETGECEVTVKFPRGITGKIRVTIFSLPA